MANIHSIWTGFRTGEVDPKLDGNVNLDKYYEGCRRLENFIPLAQGPAERRPGFRYITSAKDSLRKSRLVPFEFNTEQTYILEFGHLYARIFANQAALMGPDSFTKLLLHMDGTDASTTFLDEGVTVHAIAAHGHAQLNTADKKFGSASGLFDGNGDYLKIPTHADFDLSGGVWTIEGSVIIPSTFNITWTERANPKDLLLLGIAWNGSLFCAVGFAKA